jgi:outer membrane protein TolC
MEIIARENLSASRKNLEIARMRESVGYSGLSDVYRWESKISSDKIDLLTTNENRRIAEFALQEMLNRPFKQKFVTEAVDINDSTIFIMSDAEISKYIDNAKMKDIFSDFLVESALSDLPELKQLDAAIAAQERYLKAAKRTQYLPDVGVSAQADYDLYRGGKGSTVEPVEIQLDPNMPPVSLDMFNEPNDLSWNVGVNATIPLSQGGRLNYDRQQATVDLLTLQEDRNNISRKLTQQVISLFERASLSYPKIELSGRAAENALNSYEIVQDSYSHGVVSIVQLLDAQQAAVEANLYASISVYEYLIDVLTLQRAMGKFFILLTYEEKADFFYRLDNYIENRLNIKSE